MCPLLGSPWKSTDTFTFFKVALIFFSPLFPCLKGMYHKATYSVAGGMCGLMDEEVFFPLFIMLLCDRVPSKQA